MLYKDLIEEYKEEAGMGIDRVHDIIIRAIAELNRGILYNLYDNVSIKLNSKKDVLNALTMLRDTVGIFDDIKVTIHQNRFLWLRRDSYTINIKFLSNDEIIDIMDNREVTINNNTTEEIGTMNLKGKSINCKVINLDEYKKGDM